MKDRTSVLHHQTIWTMVAPRTSLNSPRRTWRTWRSITILERIRAATLHPEWWRSREPVFFFFTQLLSRRWETLGTREGFHLGFGLPPAEPELPDSDGRPRKEMHFTGDVSASLLISETLKLLTRPGAPLLGLPHLPPQRLTGGQSNLYVKYMYQLFKKKRERERVAIAEPSVTLI